MFRSLLPTILYSLSIAASLFVIGWYFLRDEMRYEILIASILLMPIAALLTYVENKRLDRLEEQRNREEAAQEQQENNEQSV